MRRRRHTHDAITRRPAIELNARNPFYDLRPNVVVAVLAATWIVHVATGLVAGGVTDAMTLMRSDVPEDVRDGANTLLGHLLSLQIHTLAITALFALAGKFAERHEQPSVPADAHRHDVDALVAVARDLIRRLPDDEQLVTETENLAERIQ